MVVVVVVLVVLVVVGVVVGVVQPRMCKRVKQTCASHVSSELCAAVLFSNL